MNHHQVIVHFGKMLKNLDQWLDKAAGHASAKKFEVDVLTGARLAPDAYALVQQVQAACDQAKFAAAYLTGQKAPAHPDDEKTIADVRARLKKCLAFLETVQEKDFAGAEERKVSPPWLQGKWLRGDDYMLEIGIANFYFHATMAYAILRHNGVDLGKMDYVGSLSIKDG